MSHLDRRQLLLAGLVTATGYATRTDADEFQQDVRRATDGDTVYEPKWGEKLTITVGAKKGDIIGTSDKAIQAAVDYIHRRGGGTVHILPGTYTLRSAIQLAGNVRILGSGQDSVITKLPSTSSPLIEDSDWYDQEVTVKDGKPFRVGDSIVLLAKNPHNGGQETIKRQIIARSGNRLKLNKGLRKNLWLSGNPRAASLFPLFTAEYTRNFQIENICLDGNKANNENFNGNFGGCVFLQDCSNVRMKKVTARNYNGDGFSFQICHDVSLDHCHSHDNQDLGIHPGSGSQRPRIFHCKMERNNLGLFWCWGVKFGIAEHNQMLDNRSYGISIGHNDTNNEMRHNVVKNSGKVGVLFRNDARGKDFWANRNIVEQNKIINSGGDQGIAIDIQGKTKDVKIINNEIVEDRKPMQRVAIRIDKDAQRIDYRDNRIRGFNVDVQDKRKKV